MTHPSRTSPTGLTIEIVVARPLRTWHATLKTALETAGHLVSVIVRAAPPQPAVAMLLAWESRAYGRRSLLFAPAPAIPLPSGSAAADFRVVLDGSSSPETIALVPRFDGQPGEAALIGALLAGRSPTISIMRNERGAESRALVGGHPAIEDPTILARALDDVLGKLVILLVQAVGRTAEEAGGGAPLHAAEDTPPHQGSALTFGAATLFGKVKRRLHRPGVDHWHTSWRRLTGLEGGFATRDWADHAYTTLPDDGSAYFADPFAYEHEGRRYVFCEMFPYKTGKGVIAVFEIAADGEASPPRVVLDQSWHLSYPQVFARDGSIFMLPEMGASGRIVLFRAVAFPDHWVAHAVLVEDVAAYDSSFVEFAGRCWLFAAVAGSGASSWDQLALYHAPALTGPWLAHRGNPVLIDAGSARPAGAMEVRDGVLWRVAQDCRTGYGAGLALCRVDRLDLDGYAQTVVRRLGPPRSLGAQGAHTMNQAAGLEVIDWRKPLRP